MGVSLSSQQQTKEVNTMLLLVNLLSPIFIVSMSALGLAILLSILVIPAKNSALARLIIWLTIISLWSLWIIIYMAQLHPLVVPELKEGVLHNSGPANHSSSASHSASHASSSSQAPRSIHNRFITE